MCESAPTGDTANPTELPPSHPLRASIAEAVRRVRETTPLAQSFTNFVTINLVANAQLAAGGTAAMSFLPDDVIETAKIAGANYINVGTLLPFFKDSLPEIAQRLNYLGKPWVLDPVAAGIGRTRTVILQSFKSAPPTVIRANASETIALADMWGLSTQCVGDAPKHRPAGVESIDEVDCATAAAVRLARYLNEQAGNGIADRRPDTQKPGACEPDDKTDDKHDAKTDTKTDTMGRRDTTRCAVAVSGTVDLVTDGETVYRLPGGSAMMTKITGAGCSLGGVLATYLAVADPLVAALSASLLYNRAGEQAEQGAQGPGSFQVAFLDALWNVTAEQVSGSPLLVG